MIREGFKILCKDGDLFDELMDFGQVLVLVGEVGVAFFERLGLFLEEGTEFFNVLVSDFYVEGVEVVEW